MKGDYSNGKIYFIEPICEHEDNEFYYGSTIQKLCKRMDFHRSSYKSWKNGKFTKITCFDLFEKYGLENCKIYLVELYPCKSREELESREGYYIRNYDCINKNIPGRTCKEYCKEYYKNNKDTILEIQKEYYNDNKDTILEIQKEYYNDNKDKINEIHKKYYNDNKDKILEIKKKYYNDNKDKILNNNKEYYNDNKHKINEKHKCECGGKYTYRSKSSRFKTKKHIQYTEQQNKDV